MPSIPELTALLTAGGVGGAMTAKIVDRLFTRKMDNATAEKLAADAVATTHQTLNSDVTVLRDIIVEVRASEAQKAERIDRLERRLDLLEERERHMLTRAAVHEAWDQMALSLLLTINPEHPPPPPLVDHNDAHN